MADRFGWILYSRDAAADGFEAGSKLYAFKPDVILLDMMMPGLNGFDICRQIKAAQDTCDIRVIAMTGHLSQENV